MASDHFVSIISSLSLSRRYSSSIKLAVTQTETSPARISKLIKSHLCNATMLMAVLSLFDGDVFAFDRNSALSDSKEASTASPLWPPCLASAVQKIADPNTTPLFKAVWLQ